MFKNVSGQVIGAQMITAADGTAFTGTVSCAITKDGGTQASASGSVTHEGGGYHTLACAQADTNGDLIAYTFSGTGAIPVTIQVATQDKFVSDVLNASAQTMMKGVIGSGTDGTHFTIDNIETVAGTDQTMGANALAGRRVYFLNNTTTSALRGCGARVISNTNANPTAVVIDSNDVLPATPANGDTVVII